MNKIRGSSDAVPLTYVDYRFLKEVELLCIRLMGDNSICPFLSLQWNGRGP